MGVGLAFSNTYLIIYICCNNEEEKQFMSIA